MKLSQSQRSKITQAIAQHERHEHSFFWTPFGNAAYRRATERKNNWSVSFTHDGQTYQYDSDVTCSARNYYYRGTFTVDGEKRNRKRSASFKRGAFLWRFARNVKPRK